LPQRELAAARAEAELLRMGHAFRGGEGYRCRPPVGRLNGSTRPFPGA
jgi:hypothetical protein